MTHMLARSLTLALVAAGATPALAATSLVDWSIKTKTCTTELHVADDGTVAHSRTCPAASPPTTTFDEAPLAAAELETLRAQLADANQGPFTKHDPAVDADAPYAGKVLGDTFSPPTLIVQYVPPSDTSSGVVVRNDSAGAQWLVRFAAERWHVELPRTPN
jgi:hypothetical protein